MLVSRAPDGRVRTERFESAAGYRLRLAARHAGAQGVSLDDVIELLDR
jgi:hypothetical protein